MTREEYADMALAGALIDSIDAKDKSKAHFCIDAMCVGLVILKGGDSFPMLLRTRYAHLLDCALKFITTPLSDAQIADLDKTWSVCRCNMADPLCRSMHPESGNLTKDRNLSRVIISLVALVFAALDQVTPHKLAQKASKGKWPPSSAHLLPTGPDGMVRAMVQWMRYTERTNPYQTYPLLYISRIVPFCRTAETDIAAAPELMTYFAKRFCAIADALVNDITPQGPVFPKPPEALEHLFMSWEVFVDCVDDGGPGPYLQPRAMPLLRGIKSLLAALPTVRQIPREDKAQTEAALRKMEYAVWSAIPERVRPPMDDASFAAMRDNILAMFDDHTLLYTVLSSYKDANACCGPSCFRPGDTVETPLRVCQKCGLMLYCSRECQREHWKWPRAPHRATCESVGKFWAVFKAVTSDDVVANSDVEPRERFRLEVESKGHSWEDGSKVLHALDALVEPREQRQRIPLLEG